MRWWWSKRDAQQVIDETEPGTLEHFAAKRVAPGRWLGLRLTIGLVVFGLAVWALSGLIEEVLDRQGLVRWDAAVARWFRLRQSGFGIGAFEVLTQFGEPVVWVLMVLVALVLLRRREWLLLTVWLSANVGGKLVEWVLKVTVHRHRPQTAVLLDDRSYSFPSGHTMGAVICYFMLAYVLAELLEWTGRTRALVFAAALLLVTAVGFSRVYLAVHYPSDVLGGAIAGGAWLSAMFTVLHISSGPDTNDSSGSPTGEA